MTVREIRLTAAAIALIAAASVFSTVYSIFDPGIGSSLARGERYLAAGDGHAAAAGFLAVLEKYDLSDADEIGRFPEKYAPAYAAALGYADAKALTGEGGAEAYLRPFASFGAEAALRLEADGPGISVTAPEQAVTGDQPVKWKSAVLEKIIREALSLPEGPVQTGSLDAIYDLCVFGSRYTGVNMLTRGEFDSFNEVLLRYESERDTYEGYEMNDLSDLKYFKNLRYVFLYDCGAVSQTDRKLKIAAAGR